MINLDLGTLIDKPVKDVFAFVTNPGNMSKWNSAVVSMEQITPGAVGILDVYAINSTVKVLRLDGNLPFDPGYVLKGNAKAYQSY